MAVDSQPCLCISESIAVLLCLGQILAAGCFPQWVYDFMFAVTVSLTCLRVNINLCVCCPTGSTDCICFATVGTNDAVTSALHIIVGE